MSRRAARSRVEASSWYGCSVFRWTEYSGVCRIMPSRVSGCASSIIRPSRSYRFFRGAPTHPQDAMRRSQAGLHRRIFLLRQPRERQQMEGHSRRVLALKHPKFAGLNANNIRTVVPGSATMRTSSKPFATRSRATSRSNACQGPSNNRRSSRKPELPVMMSPEQQPT